MAGDELGLRRLIFGGHLCGIAARSLALDPGDILDEDRLGAERLDLLLRRRADVSGRHLRTQPPRRRDRLQAGDAHPHDEHPRGGHGAGRRHHHREGAAVFARRVEHRLVARQVRLRGQDVHRLRARNAWHELHRQRLDTECRIGIDPRSLAKWVECCRQPRTRLDAAEAHRVGPLNTQQDIRSGDHAGAIGDGRAGIGKGAVGDRRPLACTRLDRQFRPQSDEFLHRLRRGRHPPLARRVLLQDRDLHSAGRQYEIIRMTTNATTAQTAAPYFNSLIKLP